MTLRFASLGSGSEGNALLVESASGATCTRILLDCGFGIRETVRRLERLGCTPESLNAILVTHEHSDHVGSAYAVAAKFNIPVWTSHGTYRATENLRGADRAAVRFCRADDMFSVGDLQILPYTVPHDAREPLLSSAAQRAHAHALVCRAQRRGDRHEAHANARAARRSASSPFRPISRRI